MQWHNQNGLWLSTLRGLTMKKIIYSFSIFATAFGAYWFLGQAPNMEETAKDIAKDIETNTEVNEVFESNNDENTDNVISDLESESKATVAAVEVDQIPSNNVDAKSASIGVVNSEKMTQKKQQGEVSNIPKKVIAKKASTSKLKKQKSSLVSKKTPAKTALSKNNTVKEVDQVSTKQAALTQSSINLSETDAAKKTSKFSQILDVSMNTDAKQTTDGEKGYNTQIWYFLNYQINDEYKARLWVDITKDLADSYEEKLQNTKITFSKRAYEFGKSIKYTPSITTVLPTSEKSKRNEEMILGLELNSSFSYAVNDKFRLSYNPRVGKNFHEYKTSRTNANNTEYKFIQFAGMSYSLSDKLSTSATLIYSNTWSYEGTRRDPSYVSILTLGYSVTNALSASVGTIQGGSLLERENGADKEIELYDENETTLFGNLSLSF